jgi:hypothetical protein
VHWRRFSRLATDRSRTLRPAVDHAASRAKRVTQRLRGSSQYGCGRELVVRACRRADDLPLRSLGEASRRYRGSDDGEQGAAHTRKLDRRLEADQADLRRLQSAHRVAREYQRLAQGGSRKPCPCARRTAIRRSGAPGGKSPPLSDIASAIQIRVSACVTAPRPACLSASSESSGEVSQLGHRHAGAHQVAVAIDIVDAPDRGPIFIRAGNLPRKAALRASIWPRPIVIRDVLCCMGRQPKR